MAIAECFEVEPSSGQASAAVIWLHGLGASAQEFTGLPAALSATSAQHIRFLIPQATDRPVTLNAGVSMPAWFDLRSIVDLHKDDVTGIDDSALALRQLIQQQIQRGISSRRIVLAGFSQGGSMAMYTALYSNIPLAGVIAISACMPNFAELVDQARADYQPFSQANADTPFLLLHGTEDEVVPIALAEVTHAGLLQAGYPVEYHADAGVGHAISPHMLHQVNAALERMLLEK